MDTPYAITHRRDLTAQERALVRRLVEQTGDRRSALEGQIDNLKVVARCGCGCCPGVLFGRQPDEEPKLGAFETVASLRGRARDGVDVGAYLLVRDGELSELEAIAWSGEKVREWPLLDEMRVSNDHLPSNTAMQRTGHERHA